ncbi:hypothetical protein TNCV_2059521 [Trichonephila clavipes]|uniref:Uncharacterized protein n=1 Tax=Trichonephila clavipes TaxID=2585209 RepID=A0A8X6UPG1_TRICX|nr:hypothetical protein TNCV_2059521 [Trichonephila clavipes]
MSKTSSFSAKSGELSSSQMSSSLQNSLSRSHLDFSCVGKTVPGFSLLLTLTTREPYLERGNNPYFSPQAHGQCYWLLH